MCIWPRGFFLIVRELSLRILRKKDLSRKGKPFFLSFQDFKDIKGFRIKSIYEMKEISLNNH